MITESEKNILRNNLEKYEGKIAHMYLDSNAFVTIGVGHLISNLEEAQRLHLYNIENEKATTSEIERDFAAVMSRPANKVATYYKQYTTLVLPSDEIDKLTDKHIENFEEELNILYDNFEQFPSEVKLALFDMIFNLGMTKLKNTWPKFNASIRNGDWQNAAKNSHRRAPVSEARNNYVKNLLETASRSI